MSRTSGDETVQVNGSGKRTSVDAESFTVNGTATVEKDVVVGELSVNGSLDVGGRLEGVDVDLDGSATVAGDARAEHLEIDGSGTFEGTLSVDHLDADGSTSVAGNLDGHDVESDGSTTVGGSLVANGAVFDGSVTVEGLADVTELSVDGSGTFADVAAGEVEVRGAIDAGEVRADEVAVTLGGDSTVDTLRADEISVESGDGGSLLSRLLGRGDPTLTAGTVAGDHVELDATEAETVAGETVVLGADAAVDVVYADDLDAADDATVGEVRDYAAYEESGADEREGGGEDIEPAD